MEAILRRGQCDVRLWPLYVKVTILVCVLSALLGIILLVVGSTESAGNGVVVAGAVLLGLVTLFALLVVLWMLRVYAHQSFSPQQAHHENMHASDFANQSGTGQTPVVVIGGGSASHTSSRTVLPTAINDSATSSTVQLHNFTRKESSSTIVSNGDFWGRDGSLQRLPTASNLQLAMEGQGGGGLLRLSDFQTASMDDPAAGAGAAAGLPRQASFPDSLSRASHASYGDDPDERRPVSRLARLSETQSPEEPVPRQVFAKSASSSQIHGAYNAGSRQRPRSSGTSKSGEIDALALEAASLKLAEEPTRALDARRPGGKESGSNVGDAPVPGTDGDVPTQ